METAVNECIYILEANANPMLAEEMLMKTSERVEYVRAFLGGIENCKSRNNWKSRQVLKRLLESSRVERIQLKPVVLRIVRQQETTTEEPTEA